MSENIQRARTTTTVAARTTSTSQRSQHTATTAPAQHQSPGPVALTERQLAELRDCEALIANKLKTSFEVGAALAKIKADGLYKGDYPGFGDYCKDRWGFGRSHAHRLIKAAQIVADLAAASGDIPLPDTEAQARELVRVPKQQHPQVMIRAAEMAGEGPLTAKFVREAVIAAVGERQPRRAPAGPFKKFPLSVWEGWVTKLERTVDNDSEAALDMIREVVQQKTIPVEQAE